MRFYPWSPHSPRPQVGGPQHALHGGHARVVQVGKAVEGRGGTWSWRGWGEGGKRGQGKHGALCGTSVPSVLCCAVHWLWAAAVVCQGDDSNSCRAPMPQPPTSVAVARHWHSTAMGGHYNTLCCSSQLLDLVVPQSAAGRLCGRHRLAGLCGTAQSSS
jgi:hypothetical protein